MSTEERRSAMNKYWVDIRGERFLQVEQVNNDQNKSKDTENEDES